MNILRKTITKYAYQKRNKECVRYFSSPLQRKKHSFELNFNNGHSLNVETGNYARMADGAAIVTVGDTSVLSTAVSSTKGGSSSFMPLTVDYKLKHAGSNQSHLVRLKYASNEKEILTSRAIDRSIRPLFPPGYSYETQIACQLLAVDGHHDPDVACINAASAALAVSNIPWNGPIGAVRVGLIKGKVIIFPTRRQLMNSEIDLIISANHNNLVVMLEGSGKNISQKNLLKVIEEGVNECQRIIEGINNITKDLNIEKRLTTNTSSNVVIADVEEAIRLLCENKITEIFTDFTHHKLSRDKAIQALLEPTKEQIIETHPDIDHFIINKLFTDLVKKTFRNLILDQETRCDGRSLTDLRDINCSVNLFKPLHGSSLFQRGQTQVQSTVTLDAPMHQRRVDSLLEAAGGARQSNFILSYNFPSFATNEVGRSGGGLSRREIGHGALAEKALKSLIPSNLDHSISLNATVMESNGSSSMATVCGGSLALMDAGVKVSNPAAGVAVGLVTKYNEEKSIEKYKLLTDLLGIEDFFGDMDFKIAGTNEGLTALQLDVKIPGLPVKMVSEAIHQGYNGIQDILKIMNTTISAPRGKHEKSDLMPVIHAMECPIHLRPRLYGVNGVRKIESETGVQITWVDETKLSVFAQNKSMMDEALEYLNKLLVSVPDLHFGAIYEALITDIGDRGIFVTLYEGMVPVLVHNSQLDVRNVKDARVLKFEVGQKLKLKYFGSDPATGKMRLSRRALQITKDAVKDFTSNR